MELTVCKFGGTSLANTGNIKRVCDIIKADPRRRVIVVSAPGKRTRDDIKITDILFEIHDLKEEGKNFDKPFNDFKQRFSDINREFKLVNNLDEIMEEFYTELRGQNADFITSTGEYFMAKLMADIIGFEFVDLDKTAVVSFDEAGNVDLASSRKNFEQFRGCKVIIPGFYGIVNNSKSLSSSAPAGTIKTFSRGGSDITGAIIANIADAALYENWTDVDGVYDKDPSKHSDAKKFDRLSYAEVEELARNGANVLHPDCIPFVREKNIPINLKNTFNPSAPGTLIN